MLLYWSGQVRYGCIRRSIASSRPPCDGIPSASVWQSPRQAPGPPCPYPSDRTPPDAIMKRVGAPSAWTSPSDLDKKEIEMEEHSETKHTILASRFHRQPDLSQTFRSLKCSSRHGNTIRNFIIEYVRPVIFLKNGTSRSPHTSCPESSLQYPTQKTQF